MNRPMNRLTIPLLALIGLLVLVACSPAGGEPAAADPTAAPTEAQEAVTEDATATTEPTDAPPPTAEATEAATEDSATAPAEEAATESGEEILTGDTRSDQLRSLTSSWDTNWNKRTISYDELLSGGPPRDGIPSIDDPTFVSPEEAAEWLAPNEPVIALEIDGDARAYPLQILIWHEIANDTVGDVPVAVTFCPLCNAGIVFDRRLDGEVYEFGTSGLLRNSDLVMYDRTTESLWQQLTGDAIVGDMAGKRLTFLPSSIISFADFREAYPDGIVLSRETGYDRRYGQNPYVGYDSVGASPFLYRGPVDERLPAVARVVTVSIGDTDVAYPYSVLEEMGVVNDTVGGQDLVVFFTKGTASALNAREIAGGKDVGAANVFDPTVDGETLTFTSADGEIVDAQTESTWDITGRATAGPLAGTELAPIVHGNHFWFAWAAFKPDTVVYTGGSGS